MGLDLKKSRIGLLVPELAPIWTGAALGGQSSDFVIYVSTATGTLSSGMAGMVLVRDGVELVRIKSISGNAITMAENAAPFAASDPLAIYELRLPFPRYQRLSGETVLKDWNVAFPSTWEEILPPTCVVFPEAAWVQVGVVWTFDAQNSRVMAPDTVTGAMTATWDATGWATTSAYGSLGDVTDNYCDVTATVAGFHYLRVTITDEFGSSSTHYVPVWVDSEWQELTDFSMSWALGKGWKGSGQAIEMFDHLAHSPVAVVDIEEREIVLFGFMNPQSVERAFGTEVYSFDILSPVEDAGLLHGFPFIVTDIADPVSTPPDDWSEVGKLTVPRATWFLFVWHSMLPELINIDLGDASYRRIKGQKFPAGTFPSMLSEIVSSAFLVLRSFRAGGLELGFHPLYTEAADWSGTFSTFSLASVQRRDGYSLELPAPRCIDVRLSGVYLDYTGDYEPAICRCPEHPDNWGAGTAEVTNLAPVSEAELLLWAGRHFTVENLLCEVSLDLLVDVDPSEYELLGTDVPEASVICIENITMRFEKGTPLSWGCAVSGHPYGSFYDAVSVPVPDPIEIPEPTTPPIDPPWPPLPPVPEPCEWPVRLYVVTRSRGVYFTNDFDGPLGSQPTWSRLTGTDAYAIKAGAISQQTGSVFTLLDSLTGIYRWTDVGGYENILTSTEAAAMCGGSGNLYWLYCDEWTGFVYALVAGDGGMHIMRSTDDGARDGGGVTSFRDVDDTSIELYGGAGVGQLLTTLDAINGVVTGNKTGGGGSARVFTGVIGSGSWTYADSMGGFGWAPPAYYDAHNNVIWSCNSDHEVMWLGSDQTTWNVPAGVAIGMAYSIFGQGIAFWNTNLHVTIGQYGTTYENSIQWTDDFWATFYASGDVGVVIESCVPVPYQPPNLILGRRSASGGTGEYHVIYVNDDLGATTPVGRAGVDPSNVSTTVSIPYNCGGIAYNGILMPPYYCEV